MSAATADPGSSSTPVQGNSNSREAEVAVVVAGEGDKDKEQGGTRGEDDRCAGKEGPHDVIEGGRGEGVPVIKPALVYSTTSGQVIEVSESIFEAVDKFEVPHGFVRKGTREQSYMYSVGVYLHDEAGINHKYHCMASQDCRLKKKVIPCRNGDRSNVNTHLKGAHKIQGMAAKERAQKKNKATGHL